MEINFVTNGSTYLASYRMRVEKPVHLLNKFLKGCDATINTKGNPKATINVFSKHFTPKETLEDMEVCKQEGSVVIMDVCDNHFKRDHGGFYKEAIKIADIVTCNSENMKKIIKQVCKKTAYVINDPITFNKYEPLPKEAVKNGPRILWFGHSSNLQPLLEIVPYLGHRVTVVSNNMINHPNIDFVPWMPGTVENIIQNFNIVVIPTDKSLDHIKEKSANRAVDSIFSGCHVITDNKDIYGHLKDFVTIIDNWETEVQRELIYTDETIEKIKRGQEFVLNTFGDQTIFDQWVNVLEKEKVLELEQENAG